MSTITSELKSPIAVALGEDRLHVTEGDSLVALDVQGLSDADVLKRVAELAPEGVLVIGREHRVFIDAKQVLAIAASDGFGIELTGMANLAADLIRLACDPQRADTVGYKTINNLMSRFIGLARERSVAKGPNQLHAVRFGVSAKFAGADRVEPNTLEIHPDGNVARKLAEAFTVIPADDGPDKYADLENRFVLVVRHPFILPGVYQLRFNRMLTKNLVLANRLDFRKQSKGDYDGDTGNLFPIRDVSLALRIRAEINKAVPDTDATLLVRGIAADDPEAEMWGENIFADGKTTAKKMGQFFDKTVDEWLDSHARMGDYANKYTPFAYRISDICSLMASLGIEGARQAGLAGAVIEEDYYLGLGGAPEGSGLDDALEDWFRSKMTREVISGLMNALRKTIDPALLTTEVKAALIRGAKINQLRVDLAEPEAALTHFGFRIGKGWTSYNVKPKDNIIELLRTLSDIAQSPEGEAYKQTFLGKMAFLAAEKLGPVVRDRVDLSAPDWIDEDYAMSFVDEDGDVAHLAEGLFD